VYEELVETMAATGCKTGILPIRYLESIRAEIQALHDSRIISDEVCQLIRQFHHYDYSDRDYPVNSIIVIASPSTLIRTYINYKGQRMAVVIPPTYIDYVTEPMTIEQSLNKVLNPAHYRAARVHSLPEKPLAVASGIAEYGRNNVTYVEGMGSFALLSVYYSEKNCTVQQMHSMYPQMSNRCN
jgi:epoxyqueuosine reductase